MSYLDKTATSGGVFVVCDACGGTASVTADAAAAGTVPSGWSSADVRAASAGPYTRKAFCPRCRPHRLQCACCGAETSGRQWWNRDKGFGLCDACVEFVRHGSSESEMRLNYGERGVHYGLGGGQ